MPRQSIESPELAKAEPCFSPTSPQSSSGLWVKEITVFLKLKGLLFHDAPQMGPVHLWFIELNVS